MQIVSTTFALPQLLSLPRTRVEMLIEGAREKKSVQSAGAEIPFGHGKVTVRLSYNPATDTLTVEKV